MPTHLIPSPDQETLTRIWAEYVYEDKMDPRVQPAVAEGWRRCKAAGIDPAEGGIGSRVDDAIFQSILAENRILIETALPIMQSVFDVMRQSNFTLVLTDSVGYILECIGDEAAMFANRKCHFEKGCLWSNLSVGTNAISVALDSNCVVQMVGPEHYCRSHHSGICSAAPIHNADGEVIGCLNLSGSITPSHPHSMGLILAAVQGIEGKLALRQTTELMRASLEHHEDSVLLLARNYRPIWANSAARRLFQMEEEALYQLDFRQVIPDLDWSSQRWLPHSRCSSNDVRVVTKDGSWHCGVTIYPLMDLGTQVLNVTLKKQQHLIDAANKLSGNRAVYTFGDIFTEDPGMKRILALAQTYARYDGNILIEGESGTGKELLAQAVHNESSRADGPFVAVNCSAIPRDMLEAHLFGYEAGTFPGAPSEGNPGRFELADKGTLFLDEIGDIPLEFQNKLLRAVESHCITRLGGKEEIRLDIRIIASTNHNLEADVASQAFRPELFFRLNILRLTIPPLRERIQDAVYCANRFLERLNTLHPATPRRFSPAFLAGLLRYHWPGNVRELQNGIERTFYSSTETVLGEESLGFVYGSSSVPASPPGREPDEAGRIRSTLAICGGDVDAAAEKLGMSRATLYRRFKKYGIKPQRLK